jgi:hypothetical protein
MSYGNRTGPAGAGPRTGRGAGYCGGYGAPGYASPLTGRGVGVCWGGGGHGWRHWYYATGLPGRARPGRGVSWHQWTNEPFFSSPTREQELEELKAQAEYFRESLNAIGRRIEELESNRVEEK